MAKPLQQTIAEAIAGSGPLRFDRFMEMALYAPGAGYYQRPPSIGRAGDFYTSPHIHPVFGALIGVQIREMWQRLGKPGAFDLVEMGPGAGYLARDLLDYLKQDEKRDGLYGSLRYTLIERSPAVRTAQQQLLAEHVAAGRVAWHEELGGAGGIHGCLLSNELLDAFPVRLIEMGQTLSEVFVDINDGMLVETLRPAGRGILDYMQEFHISLPYGCRTEVCLVLEDWLQQAAASLAAGYVISIDYGYSAAEYYRPDRNRGTLACYRGHQFAGSPYTAPGERDITAHVNFSALKQWGSKAGLAPLGYCAQGPWLVSLGLEELLPLYAGRPPDPVQVAQATQLFSPRGLGESHKVMVQGISLPGTAASRPLQGFALRNDVDKL